MEQKLGPLPLGEMPKRGIPIPGGGGGMTMRSKAPKSQRLGGIYLVITVSFMSSSYSYFEHMKKESWSSISSYEAPS